MSTELPSQNPTGYLGLRETNVGQLYFKTRNPINTIDFKPYTPGDRWINTVADTVWTLVRKTTTTGIWIGNTAGPAQITQITPDFGLPIVPVANNVNLFGDPATGTFTTSTAADTITISASFPIWIQALVDTTMLPNRGYFTAAGAPLLLTLPLLADIGTVIYIEGAFVGGWSIVQNAGQQIVFDSAIFSTAGIGGSVSSSDGFDGIQLLCTVADTIWTVLNVKGNPVYV